MMIYALKFGKNGYYPSTWLTKDWAKYYQKQRGGKVVKLNTKEYNKIFGVKRMR